MLRCGGWLANGRDEEGRGEDVLTEEPEPALMVEGWLGRLEYRRAPPRAAAPTAAMIRVCAML